MAILALEGYDNISASTASRVLGWYTAGTIAKATGAFSEGECLKFTGLNIDFGFVGGLSKTTLYFNVRAKWARLNVNNECLFTFYENATAHCSVGFAPNSNNGTLKLYRGTNTDLSVSSSTAIVANVWTWIGIKVVIHDTTGEITLYQNGVQTATYSGDTRVGGTGVVTGINFHWRYTSSPYGEIYFDDFICSDSQIYSSRHVYSLYPTGAGNYAQWTPSAGSNYQNVDEDNVDDNTTYNSSSTPNQLDSFSLENCTPSTIEAAKVQLFTYHDDAGPHSVAPNLRIGTTDYNGSTVATTAAYAKVDQIYTVSPASSVAWTQSEINGLELGYKLVS